MISRRSDRGTTAEEESTKRLHHDNVIIFTNEDAWGIQTPHDDTVVVSTTIANYDVKKILVDNGSSTNVLFYSTFSQMRLSIDRLRRVSTPLVDFAREAVVVEGEISFPVTAGTEPRQSTVHMTFTIVQVPSAYNAILGRPGLNTLRAIVSTYHLLVWFSTKNGAEKMHGDQQLIRQCFQISTQSNELKDSLTVDKLDQREEEKRGEPAE